MRSKELDGSQTKNQLQILRHLFFLLSERSSGGLKRREVLLLKSIVALNVFSVADQLTSHFKSSDLCFIEFPCVEQSHAPVGICFPNGLSNHSTFASPVPLIGAFRTAAWAAETVAQGAWCLVECVPPF